MTQKDAEIILRIMALAPNAPVLFAEFVEHWRQYKNMAATILQETESLLGAIEKARKVVYAACRQARRRK